MSDPGTVGDATGPLGSVGVLESTGACSGTGVFSGITEGSLLIAYDEESGEKVGAAVLPTGREIVEGDDPDFLVYPSEEGTGCLFDLGNPLGALGVGHSPPPKDEASRRGYGNVN